VRIAIVIENFHPTAGGNERSTQQIARRLIDRGHHVTVLTNTATPRDEALPGGVIVKANGPGTGSARGIMRFRKWAMRELDLCAFDVSLSVTTVVPATVVQPRGGTALETQRRNIALRPSAIHRIVKQALLALNPKRWALLAAERSTLNSPRVKKIAAVSRYVADQLVHHYTVPFRRIEVIPNAAEVARFTHDEEARRRAETRRSHDIDENDHVFLFAAMNPTLKGFPHLLHAFVAVHAEHADARLLVAGKVTPSMKRRARQLGVADAVTFLGPTRDMDALYNACDVTVLPTWYDPSSKVVLESLLHARPAVSTLYNGAAQWILSPTGDADIPSPFSNPKPEQLVGPSQMAGRVIDSPDNIDALIDAMDTLCDPEERAACAAATHDLHARISMDAHVDRLEALFNEVT